MFGSVDYFSLLQNAVSDFMLSAAPQFWDFGHRVFLAAVLVRLAIMFYTVMYRPRGDNEFFVGKTLVQIAIGYWLITFYSVPDPLFGVAFSRLIVTLTSDFARVLDAAVMTTAITTLDQIFAKFIAPGFWEGLAQAIYYTIFAVITIAKFLSLAIVALSLWAQAIFVLFGPIFVSLFLLPYAGRLFFKWLDAFLEYSFLQATAFAYLFIGVHVLGAFVTQVPAGLTSDLYITWGGIILTFLGVYVLGFFKIERINASLFHGMAAHIGLSMPRVKW